MSFSLPAVPAPHNEFISYLASNPDIPLRDLVKPYNVYEAKLREGFAQYRGHDAVQANHVNAVPIFTGQEQDLRIRARDRAAEHTAEAERYIMPLRDDLRKADGSPAIVQSLQGFRDNFNLFSEQSLADLDWSNVVAAGSSVVTALLPVPDEYATSKRALREYYHQKLAPSSDVDLFIWGLDEEAALKKIAQIEACVRNSILAETTTIRTKNAITIASKYPTRHVQIVLRLYKSLSEVLTGFDVDCSCFAYDGQQVYATPRGITSFCSQINTIDLTRRSPSYESRLAKYAHRGFEVYFSDLVRKRVDPTLYDRSFARTWGLARLLVLERLPKESDRERYINKRRQERGRPPLDLQRGRHRRLPNNMKDHHPEDVPEWDLERDVSDYHTFTVPYGPNYHAKKIERLLYVKDMLLNAEWNQKKERKVHLHRHPCFIGDVASIRGDCCGACPEPTSEEEKQVAEEERKIYVYGNVQFMKDDPGRQAIGSFNPLNADDWTDMAYLGNTQAVCTAIIDGDVDAVVNWCSQEGNDVNHRDHTGRTPLQLAVMTGQLEALKVLIENGARLTARVADGFTALHMAAAAGRVDMIKLLADKSEENEEAEARKGEVHASESRPKSSDGDTELADADVDVENRSDTEMIDAEDTESDKDDIMTQGSFVKVSTAQKPEDNVPEDDIFTPDVYDANVLAWDSPVSPLHVAILSNQIGAVDALVNTFGADVLLPVKLKHLSNPDRNQAILTLILAAKLPHSQTRNMTQKLLELGAKPSQSDIFEVSALHAATVLKNVESVKAMFDGDLPSANAALDHVNVMTDWGSREATTPLLSALRTGNFKLVNLLLDAGAKITIKYEQFRDACISQTDKFGYLTQINRLQGTERQKLLKSLFAQHCRQPILVAVQNAEADLIRRFIALGSDINTVDENGSRILIGELEQEHNKGSSLLDLLDERIERLEKKIREPETLNFFTFREESDYLQGLNQKSYRYLTCLRNIQLAKSINDQVMNDRKKRKEKASRDHAKSQRGKQAQELKSLKKLREELISKGAQKFYDLHPSMKVPENVQRWGFVQKDFHNVEAGQFAPEPVTFTDPNISEEKERAYERLYEAVWQQDLNKIKALTLQETEDDSGNQIPPLHVAVQDSFGINVFGMAIVQGNLKLATAILDIAHAQFQPEDKTDAPKKQFRIRGAEEEDYEYDSDDIDQEDEIKVTSELVSDKFTVDDLAQLGRNVGSRITPARLLTWKSPIWALSEGIDTSTKDAMAKYRKGLQSHPLWGYNPNHQENFQQTIRNNWQQGLTLLMYAAIAKDFPAFKFLLEKSLELADAGTSQQHSEKRTSRHGCWSEDELSEVLHYCIRRSQAEFTEYLITNHGAGMPIDEMARGIKVPEEEREKPLYYQGLKLYGKHKKAWAASAAGNRGAGKQNWRAKAPAPFLKAVYLENRQSIEFWQSDACLRMYEEYGKRHTDVKEVQLIDRKLGGWANATSDWLKLRRELALHCLILRGNRKSQKDEMPKMTKYVLETVPESLMAKSISGQDPLYLAFAHQQVENANLLIEAGADITTRDGSGLNIMHAMMNNIGLHNAEEESANLERIDRLLRMVDPLVLPSLFTDRCKLEPTGLTPLALAIEKDRLRLRLFELLARYMPSEVLSMFDGAGQTPVHRLVIDNANTNDYNNSYGFHQFNYRVHKNNKTEVKRLRDRAALLRAMVQSQPQLLLIENSAGQTPLELARSRYLHNETRWPVAPPIYNMSKDRDDDDSDDMGHAESEDQLPWTVRVYRLLKELHAEYQNKQEKQQQSVPAGDASGERQTEPMAKRKMISIRDANEVAKRLAETKAERDQAQHFWDWRRRQRQRRDDNDDDDDNEGNDGDAHHDEVERWG